MATTIVPGKTIWELTRDDEGYREYDISFLVECDSKGDGPFMALNTPGLPLPGAPWAFDNDFDPYAWCRPNASVKQVYPEGEPNKFFRIGQKFSNKPVPRDKQRCQDTPIEDPLYEPPKMTVSSSKHTEEATTDRFGIPLLTSSLEMLRGPQVEFDKGRGSIRIEQNVMIANIALLRALLDRVNELPLFGHNSRCVKLSAFSVERQYHGLCSIYYKRVLEFEFNDDTFDRDVLDEGTKVLFGDWDRTTPPAWSGATAYAVDTQVTKDSKIWVCILAHTNHAPPNDTYWIEASNTAVWIVGTIRGAAPNPANPSHFIRFKDRNGENCKVVLNGAGLPSSVITKVPPRPAQPYYIAIAGNGPLSGGVKPLTDTLFWVPQIGGDSEYDSSISYPMGSVVARSSFATPRLYVASEDIEPGANPPESSTRWIYLENGIIDRGLYDDLLDYEGGDRVEVEPDELVDGTEERSGYIHIEKYDNANFLILGIPTEF